MADIRRYVSAVARDLTTIEINTIRKPFITGQKMPPPRHALIDIGKEYYETLTRLGATPDNADPNRLGSWDAFNAFREAAKARASALTSPVTSASVERDAETLMLDRIKDLSDQIKGMMNDWKARDLPGWDNNFSRDEIEGGKAPELQVTPNDLILLRKVWELGTEEIAMQTVVQLDGDVVTRIAPGYTDALNQALHKIHDDGVQLSVGFWRDLIGIVTDLLDSFARSVLGRR